MILESIYLIGLRHTKGVNLGKGIRLKKLPNISLVNGATLRIGDNVTINSDNKGHHINMHSPSKILIDHEGAEVVVGDNTRINGACIHAWKSIRIGKNCLIAANSQIIDSNGHDLSMDNPKNRISTKGKARPIVIEDNVWIAANVIVLPGVRIGEGSVIGAGSVVNSDIPPGCVAMGNPAQVIERRKENSDADIGAYKAP